MDRVDAIGIIYAKAQPSLPEYEAYQRARFADDAAAQKAALSGLKARYRANADAVERACDFLLAEGARWQ